jgi:hypothetical protein
VIYLPISIGAVLFLIAASVFVSYPTVARVDGMDWVGPLSLIISMPIVTLDVK